MSDIEPLGSNTGTAIILFSAVADVDPEDPDRLRKSVEAADRYWYVPHPDRPDTMRASQKRIDEACALYKESGELPGWVIKAADYLSNQLVRQASEERATPPP